MLLDLGAIAVGLAAGDNHTCALLDGGGVMCWGMNTYGQLGDGKTVNMPRPIAVGKGKGAVVISIILSCALHYPAADY